MRPANGEWWNRSLAMLAGGLLALLLALMSGVARAAPDAAWAFDLMARVEQWQSAGPLDFLPNAAKDQPIPAVAQTRIQADYGRLPMHFEPNLGQTADEVKYVARGPGYTLFLTADEAVLALRPSRPAPDRADLRHRRRPFDPAALTPDDAPAVPGAVIRTRLEGATRNPAPQPKGVEKLPGISNYFLGNDPAKWRTNVPHYQRVRYPNVYPGIDLVYYGNPQRLEYDFIIAPGADPAAIQLAISGAEEATVNAAGDLVLKVLGGAVVQQAPKIHQVIDGRQQAVAGRYVLQETAPGAEPVASVAAAEPAPQPFLVGFEVAQYDREQPLVIDPVLVYSTYLGGNSDDLGTGIAVDSTGNAYVTGLTLGNFPTVNALYPNSMGFWDAFVVKLNASGTELVYSTYFGGSSTDSGNGIAVDSTGNAYVTGFTNSPNFPIRNALQPSLSGAVDAFVVKLNASGTELVYSTYFGGSDTRAGYYDIGTGIAIDSTGNAYVTGQASSADFPIHNALQPNYGGNVDVFIAKLNASGSALFYSTFLGSGGNEWPYGIAVDGSGNAYVTGLTESADFPTVNALYPNLRGDGVFIAKLNASGSALFYSTFFGGSGNNEIYSIAVDGSGNAYVTGATNSPDFPTVNALYSYSNCPGGAGAIVTKLNASGSALFYSTFLCGERGTGIAVDSTGNAYVTGLTLGNFPIHNALQPNYGGNVDAFVVKLNASGTELVYSTYLGGSGEDWPYGIAVDGAGNAYVTGQASSADFPTQNALYPNLKGVSDAFIVKIANGGGITETPEQPIYGDPPPVITVPSGVKKHLVLLIHGWISDPNAWAVDMKESIARQLDDSYSGDPCDKDHLVKVGNIYWQICTYSWKELANTGFLDPWKAYVNALDVGKVLAKYIVDEQHGYDFIHFIAHSAGSQVADTAATWLPILIDRYNKDNPATPLTIPDIYTTFLDAFDPRGDSSPYGKFSNWAEQYVDSRRTGPAGLDDFTNITLPNAYNFDVTALDPNPPGPAGIDAHAWPYKWYQSTIDDNIVGYGFGLSLESGNTSFPPKNGKRCFFTSNTICSEDDKAAKQVELRVVVDDVLALPLDAAITSITGTVLFEQIIGENILKLITGSPAWASLPIKVTEPIDNLSFDYTYLRQAEGLLSVLFDDQLVYRSDQRVEPSGTNQSGNVPIGAIASGTHTLSFRLDAFNGTQSEIDLSNIQLGKMEVSTPADTTPPVITPTVNGTLGQNGWYISDVTVSWEVTDAESDINFTSRCETTTVSTDTTGVTFTCSATSGGGPASQSVTIKRDATPPTITGSASPAASANGWRNSAVTVSFTCDDALSGIATCTAPQTLGEGTNQSASGTATDKAGNTATTQVTGISVDMTPPVIAGMPTTCTLWPPNHKMVQVATVTATDALSGVAPGSFSVTGASNEPFDPSDPDIVIQPNGSGSFTVQLRADRLGTGTGRIYTLTATATDRGGNTATSTSTCKVPHDQGKSN